MKAPLARASFRHTGAGERPRAPSTESGTSATTSRLWQAGPMGRSPRRRPPKRHVVNARHRLAVGLARELGVSDGAGGARERDGGPGGVVGGTVVVAGLGVSGLCGVGGAGVGVGGARVRV